MASFCPTVIDEPVFKVIVPPSEYIPVPPFPAVIAPEFVTLPFRLYIPIELSPAFILPPEFVILLPALSA